VGSAFPAKVAIAVATHDKVTAGRLLQMDTAMTARFAKGINGFDGFFVILAKNIQVLRVVDAAKGTLALAAL
jgi:hypothetical protein